METSQKKLAVGTDRSRLNWPRLSQSFRAYWDFKSLRPLGGADVDDRPSEWVWCQCKACWKITRYSSCSRRHSNYGGQVGKTRDTSPKLFAKSHLQFTAIVMCFTRNSYDMNVLAIAEASVRLSATPWHCIKTATRRIMKSSLWACNMILFFVTLRTAAWGASPQTRTSNLRGPSKLIIISLHVVHWFPR